MSSANAQETESLSAMVHERSVANSSTGSDQKQRKMLSAFR